MKKILIAGGAGFIGSHLCNKLIKDNFIYCIDNFLTGNINNIQHLLNKPNFKLINHNIINPIDLKVDEIYNLACPASPKKYFRHPIETLKTSFIGTLNLLELTEKNNAKFLQASTSEIYGDPLMHPQKEDYYGNVNPIGPRACYDEGKRCAETLCINFKKTKNLDIKIIRIFNTYGPNMDVNDGRVISNFIVQALTNQDITIYGNGKQTRSFCYIDDLINGIIKMMNSNYSGPVNLGNPEEYTILDIAKKIIILTNSKSNIIFLPKQKDDPKKRKPNITLVKEKLNWAPTIPLKKGLKKTIEYLKDKI